MNGSKKIIIIGTKSLAEMVVDIAKALNYDIVGFVDDFNKSSHFQNKPILGTLNNFLKNKKFFDCSIFVAIGDNKMRRNIFAKINSTKNYFLPNLIHPNAEIVNSSNLKLGNNLIFPQAYVGSNCNINSGNIIFSGVRINHHNTIGSFNFFAPNMSIGGNTKVGDLCKFGMNSVILPYKNLGDDLHTKPLEIL